MGNINANDTVMGNRSIESVTYRGKQVTIPSLDAVAAYRKMLRQKLVERAQKRWGEISADIHGKKVALDTAAILSADSFVSTGSPLIGDLFVSADAQEKGIALPLDASLYDQGHQGVQENLLSILRTADRLLVLGEPGAGKTVALERLAWELCLGQEPVIPVTVSLADYDGTPLAKWVWARLQEGAHLQLESSYALAAFLEMSPARCFFLFDGLNEVALLHQDTLKNELARLMAGCPRHAVICTSRSQDDGWKRLSSEMQVVVVQPIDNERAVNYMAQAIDYVVAYMEHAEVHLDPDMKELEEMIEAVNSVDLREFLVQMAHDEMHHIPAQELSSHEQRIERIRDWLVVALRADQVLKPKDRAEAGNILSKLGDPRFRADAWFLPDEPLLGFVEIPEGMPLIIEGKESHQIRLPTYYTGLWRKVSGTWDAS